MKKGKTSRLVGFPDAKINYGTVDSKNLKSIYLNIQSWVTPKDEYENVERVVSTFGKSIKNSVYEVLDRGMFKEKYIVDLDLRTSGITYGKKSFMNLEITLFFNTEIEFKDPKLKLSLKKIAREIYVNSFKKSSYFDFTISKKVKEL
jgi:hypothetical protein